MSRRIAKYMGVYSEEEKELMDRLAEFKMECRKNRVYPECEFINLFRKYIDTMKIIVPKDKIMYRARIYHNEILDKLNIVMSGNKAENLDDYRRAKDTIKEYTTNISNGFEGYDEKGSFVNLNTENIMASRCNHNFEVCLYASDDAQTAISELKPLIKETISVASIKVLKDLKIIDLSFEFDDKDNEKIFVRNLLALLFICSPTENNKDAYIYTQVICSIVKKMGYDGIKYSSCQNIERINYAIFNYEKCKAIGSKKYSVKNIDYRIEYIK